MWSANKRRESETDRRRRMREEGREEPVHNDGRRAAGMWMVFFLGAAAVSIYSASLLCYVVEASGN